MIQLCWISGVWPLRILTSAPTGEPSQPFLLVFCTGHVVTVPTQGDGTRSAGYSGFPAYSRMLTTPLPAWRATKLP